MHRKDKLVVGEYYHVFNRGVEKRVIFQDREDYAYFLESLVYFNTEISSWMIRRAHEIPQEEDHLVDLVAYCLNPNHFHLLLKEKKKDGISTFMKKVCTGYSMYFNKKNNRSGTLFQGRYKSVHINSNDLLLYVSAYVNCNSEVHGIEKASEYPWCSFREYMNGAGIGCQKDIILSQFENSQEYKVFCRDKVSGMKEPKDIEKTKTKDLFED